MAFSECVSSLAILSKQPSFWWDYKILDDERCNMPSGTFTLECSESVVRFLGGDTRLHKGGGIQAIYDCAGEFDSDKKNVLLENAVKVGCCFLSTIRQDRCKDVAWSPLNIIASWCAPHITCCWTRQAKTIWIIRYYSALPTTPCFNAPRPLPICHRPWYVLEMGSDQLEGLKCCMFRRWGVDCRREGTQTYGA